VWKIEGTTGLWTRVNMNTRPAPTAVVLPPDLETYDASIGDVWFVLKGDWGPLDGPCVRLLVFGEGRITGTTYGVFLGVRVLA
jgi:hypothetical protein